MISPLTDLETRRKILFVDDYLTIRSLGTDSVLITLSAKKPIRHAIEKALAFLRIITQSTPITSMIVDISQASSLTVIEALAFNKIKNQGFQRFAVLSKKFRIRLLFPFLVPHTKSSRFKLFKDFTSALAWVRK
jgi:hypothetical protein